MRYLGCHTLINHVFKWQIYSSMYFNKEKTVTQFKRNKMRVKVM